MTSSYEESILRSLRRISQASDLHSRQLIKKHDLTVPQLVCLRHLQAVGQATPGELARAVSLSQGTLTGILKRLQSRGLIYRTPHSQDRRRVLISLTEQGAHLASTAPSPLQDIFAQRLAGLHEGEQALFDWVLQRIVSLMQDKELPGSPFLATLSSPERPRQEPPLSTDPGLET